MIERKWILNLIIIILMILNLIVYSVLWELVKSLYWKLLKVSVFFLGVTFKSIFLLVGINIALLGQGHFDIEFRVVKRLTWLWFNYSSNAPFTQAFHADLAFDVTFNTSIRIFFTINIHYYLFFNNIINEKFHING